MESIIFPIFLSLPAPLKISLTAVMGFVTFGWYTVDVGEAEAAVIGAEIGAQHDGFEVREVQRVAEKAENKAAVVRAVPAQPIEKVRLIKPGEPAERTVVRISVSGELKLDGEVVSQEQLAQKLKGIAAQNKDQPVELHATSDVKMEQVTALMKTCQAAGLNKVSYHKTLNSTNSPQP